MNAYSSFPDGINLPRSEAPALLSAPNLIVDYASVSRPVHDPPDNYLDVISSRAGDLAIVIGNTGSADPLPALCARHFLQGAISLGQTKPQPFTRGLNAMIYDCCETKGYLSCFYAQYSRCSSMLRYVNAGHEAPLLIRGLTDEVLRLEKGGPVLGLQARPTYAQGSLQLRPGDQLVAFTHGVVESLARQTSGSAEAVLVNLMKSCRHRRAAELVSLIIAKTGAVATETCLDLGVIAARVDATSAGKDALTIQTNTALLAEA
jgi:sigma-B regulation protein RsbU (phosphoserine phosphatase)